MSGCSTSTVQLGLAGLADESQKKHVRLFMQDGQLVVLMADEDRHEGSAGRHEAVATIPLKNIERFIEAIGAPSAEPEHRLAEFLGRNVLVGSAADLRMYEFVVGLPLTEDALTQLSVRSGKKTVFQLDRALEGIRIVSGDRLPRHQLGLAVLIAKKPDSDKWVAPWFCAGVLDGQTVALCKTAAIRELPRLFRDVLEPLLSPVQTYEEFMEAFEQADLLSGYPFCWSDSAVQELRRLPT